MAVLLPSPYLFLNEFSDHPDHIFKSALEHLGFSSLPAMPRAFWKVQPGDPFFVTHCLYLRGKKSPVYCQCSEECHGLGRSQRLWHQKVV